MNLGQCGSIARNLNHDTEHNSELEHLDLSPSAVFLLCVGLEGKGGRGDWRRRLLQKQVTNLQRAGYFSSRKRNLERASAEDTAVDGDQQVAPPPPSIPLAPFSARAFHLHRQQEPAVLRQEQSCRRLLRRRVPSRTL